jgi:hypothetical protein
MRAAANLQLAVQFELIIHGYKLQLSGAMAPLSSQI